MIFHPQFTVENINNLSENCLVSHLGIKVTEVGDDFIIGKMPVDHRTKQPFGLLHGGASVVLAETLGSMASSGVIDPLTKQIVGLDINANHVKSAKSGYVIGIAKPLHLGNRTHVWEIRISNEAKELVCISRFTASVIDKR